MPQTHRTVIEISCKTDIQSRYYDISTVSLVVAFYWNICIKMQQI